MRVLYKEYKENQKKYKNARNYNKKDKTIEVDLDRNKKENSFIYNHTLKVEDLISNEIIELDVKYTIEEVEFNCNRIKIMNDLYINDLKIENYDDLLDLNLNAIDYANAGEIYIIATNVLNDEYKKINTEYIKVLSYDRNFNY